MPDDRLAAQPDDTPPTAGSADSNSLRVLLIDDDPADAARVRMALKHVPWAQVEVVSTSSVDQARAAAHSWEPDAIITDLNLGTTTGIDTVNQVLTISPAAAVIVMTGSPTWATEERSVNQGVQQYLAKDDLTDDQLYRVLRQSILRKRHTERIIHSLLHDPVTGLLNRAGIEEVLESIGTASPLDVYGIVFLDLDGFKAINDRQGHAGGDRALALVAERLQQTVRQSDVLARWGGDEFMIVVPQVAGINALVTLSHRVREAVALPMLLDGDLIAVTASIGCSVGLPTAVPSTAVRAADQAMYEAKRSGKNRIVAAPLTGHLRRIPDARHDGADQVG